MSGLILNPKDMSDDSAAGRELKFAMCQFMTAWVNRFPQLAGATFKGFKITITVADGTRWEAHGGAAPLPDLGGIAPPNGGIR